jgi:plasmid stabilization system protein ParE
MQKMPRISLSEEAQTDADAAIDWYIGEGAFIAADDFINEIERALGLLKQFPSLGEVGTQKARSFPLHGFPYSLIYCLQGDTVRVIAVAHHSRRPRYWAGRR